jgi:hypothetical protein
MHQLLNEVLQYRFLEICWGVLQNVEVLSIELHYYLPSGTRVTAHPPPPAPVSLVCSAYGLEAVLALMASSVGWDTPNVTKYE